MKSADKTYLEIEGPVDDKFEIMDAVFFVKQYTGISN